MADIAKKAGVAAGTIYRYFESKDVLITELHRELTDKINVVLQEGYPSGKPLREKFLYLFREILQYFIKNPVHCRYLEQYFNSPYGISLRRDRLISESSNQGIMMDIFDQGIEKQILKELPKAVLISLAFGPLTSLVREQSLGFINFDENLIKQTAEACWDAIKR
jgi:AcrR family transcriptional regulator